ncbi:MAG TPA: sugar phosphate isomerase/epimerase [Mycobacteriales bacterium]|nr:sugar phosphate isomerase/epimerase [Mycobacteriales bacterium]
MRSSDDGTRPLSRRALLAGGAGVVSAAAVGVAEAAAKPVVKGSCPPASAALLPPQRIGIQLYTVRDQIQSIGFAKTFAKLAEMGFSEVEFAGYTQGTGPISIKQLRRLLDDHGLRGVGCHSGASVGTIGKAIDDALALGLPSVGIADAPGATPLGGTKAQWQQSADDMNRMGQAARKHGLTFYWHNHATEFSLCLDDPTTRAYDVLLAETDAKLVFMELDVYWAYVGQYQYGRAPLPTFDPLAYLLKHPQRYPLFHVKDGRRNPRSYNGYDIVDVGQGHIDFEAFFRKLGHRERYHFLNEQDEAGNHPRGSMVSARCSYSFMRSLR